MVFVVFSVVVLFGQTWDMETCSFTLAVGHIEVNT